MSSVMFSNSSFFSNQCPRWGSCRATTCVQIQGYQTEEKEKAQISGNTIINLFTMESDFEKKNLNSIN